MRDKINCVTLYICVLFSDFRILWDSKLHMFLKNVIFKDILLHYWKKLDLV